MGGSMAEGLPEAENECTSKYSGESWLSGPAHPAPGAKSGTAREMAPSPAWLWNRCHGPAAEESRPPPGYVPFPSDGGPHSHATCRTRPPPPHSMHESMDSKFCSPIPWMRHPYHKETPAHPPPVPQSHPPFPPPPPHLFRPHHRHGHHHQHHHHKHHPWYRFGPPYEFFHSTPSGASNAASESSQAGDPKSGHGSREPWRFPQGEPFPPFQHSDESSPFSKFSHPVPSSEATSSPSQTLKLFDRGKGPNEPPMPLSPSPLLAPPHLSPHRAEAKCLSPLPTCVDKFTCDSDSKEDSNSRFLSGLSSSESKTFSIKLNGRQSESLNKSEESEESSKRLRMSVDPEESVPPHKKNKGLVGKDGELKASDLTLGGKIISMPVIFTSKTQSNGREGYMEIDLEKLPSEYMKNMQTEIIKCVKKESIKRSNLEKESEKLLESERLKRVSLGGSKPEKDEIEKELHPSTNPFALNMNAFGTEYSGALDLFTYGNGFRASAAKTKMKNDPLRDTTHTSFSASTTFPASGHPTKSKMKDAHSFSVIEKEKKSRLDPTAFKYESGHPREEATRRRNSSPSPHPTPAPTLSEPPSHLDPKLILVRFMSKIGLSNYVSSLVDAWVDMDELQIITDSELMEIGVSEEACKNIRHGLLKFKGGRDEEVVQYILSVGKLEEFVPLFSWIFMEDLYQMDMKDLLRLGLPEGPCSRLLRALNRTKRTQALTEIKSPKNIEEIKSIETDEHSPYCPLPPAPPVSPNPLSDSYPPNANQQKEESVDEERVCLDDPPDSTGHVRDTHASLHSVLIDELKPLQKHSPMDMKAAIAGVITAAHGACDGSMLSSIASIAPALTEVLSDLLKHQKLTD